MSRHQRLTSQVDTVPSPGEWLDYRQVESQFGIRRTALLGLRRRNLVQWSKVPGSSFRYARASLERLVELNGQKPTPTDQAPINAKPLARKRKAAVQPPAAYRVFI